MPHTYMVAVGPAPTGRICRSAVSYSRSCGPCPGRVGMFGAGHDCMASTLRCSVSTVLPRSLGSPKTGSVHRTQTTTNADPFPSDPSGCADRVEQDRGQVLPAHHEVRQVGVGPVVDQLRP